MDFRYVEFLKKGSLFYEPVSLDKIHSGKTYGVNNKIINETWHNNEDQDWNCYIYDYDKMPAQGWKIHLTTKISEAQKVLDKITPLLLKTKTAFKFVPNERALLFKNSKYADRGSAGKFITIYPNNENEFIDLLSKLATLTSNFKPGAYILNDKQWYDSNVFFRYGGFKANYVQFNGKKVLAIKDNENTMIPDLRVPYYSVPEFVKEPPEIIKMSNFQQKKFSQIDTTKFDKYEVVSAIHFSDGGGVYKVKKDDKLFIMKEGRSEAGLDSLGNDGYTRLKNEYKELKKLKSNPYTVNVFDYFEIWQNNYLIEDFVNGDDISEMVAQNFPFSPKQNKEEYKNNAFKILRELNDALDKIHDCQIAIGDLQPNNVMVTEGGHIKLIDLETSTSPLSKYIPGLQTLGFVSQNIDNFNDADWFAFMRISRFLFLPIEPVSDLSSDIETTQNSWISDYFGKDVINFLDDINKKVNNNSIQPEEKHIKLTSPKFTVNYTNKKLLINGLRKGIIQYTDDQSDNLSPGDIKQYIDKLGAVNIANGGFGIAMALEKTGNVPNNITRWCKKSFETIIYNINDEMPLGLFNGIMGISSVLFDLGLKNEAQSLLEVVQDHQSGLEASTDYSIYSGLSGIGINFVAFYSITKNEKFMKLAKSISSRLIKLFSKGRGTSVDDESAIPYGILNGWSGASLFLLSLYKISNKQIYMDYAEKMLNYEIENNITIEKKLDLAQISDSSIGKNRLVPYIGEGSAGVAIVLIEFMKYDKFYKSTKYQKLVKKMLNTDSMYCTYSSGLTRGASGLINSSVSSLSIEEDTDLNCIDRSIQILRNYILENEKGNLLLPGDYGYKFSNDLFTGSAGVLLSIYATENNNWGNWFPLPKDNKLELFV